MDHTKIILSLQICIILDIAWLLYLLFLYWEDTRIKYYII